jgi:putative phosphoesterase
MTGQRLLVLSDTHGNLPALEAVLKWAESRESGYSFHTAVFLGDGVQDLYRTTAAFSPEWITVKGNNDYAPAVPEAAVLDFCGRRFFLCHGHRYSLYNGYGKLAAAARGAEAEAALFGHIHVPFLENTDGLLLVSPGSIGRPRSSAGACFAVINCIPEKPLDVEFWGVNSRTLNGKFFFDIVKKGEIR